MSQPRQLDRIHVEQGDSRNVFAAKVANSAAGNVVFNLLDNNSNCDNNTWTNNIYTRLIKVSRSWTAKQ